jgi:short-subunit dehydrogenase
MNKCVIVITGHSEGIGQATAKILHNLGHTVYGLSRQVKKEIPYQSFSVDITNESEVSEAIKTIISKEGRIDVLINNAGMGISGALENTSLEDARMLFDVNFFGSVSLMKQVIPHMRDQSFGKIINISSLASAFPLPFQAFYSASKAALTNLSLALYNEVSPFNIDICVLLPGDIKTSFTRARKKNSNDHTAYNNRVSQSIATMEKDEQNGMSPDVIGHYISKMISKKRMPKVVTLGFKYTWMLRLEKLLPTSIVIKIIGALYGFKNNSKR